jgi:hypothetical protein
MLEKAIQPNCLFIWFTLSFIWFKFLVLVEWEAGNEVNKRVEVF